MADDADAAAAAARLALAEEEPTVAIQPSEQQFRVLIERGSDLIAILDRDGAIRYASPSHQRALGYPPAKLVGVSALDLLHPDDRSLIAATLEKLLLHPDGLARAEYRLRHHDGSYRTFAAVGRNLVDDPVVCGIVINSYDITERKDAEEALRRGEERFRAIYEGAAIGIALLRRERGIVAANPALQAMLGYSEEELRAHSLRDRVHPDDLTIDQELFAELAAGKRRQYRIEKRYRHKDGRIIWGRLTMANVGEGHDLAEIIATLEDITEQKVLETRFIYDALHDPLTGLPNRALLLDRLEHALARSARQDHYLFAVLFIDLDRFKVINDRLGHLVGDQVLIAVAERVAGCLRPGDTVARLGGDEFVVLLDDIRSRDDAVTVATRIQAALRGALTIEGAEVPISASIGISLNEDDSRRAERLLHDADTAMYQAKARGRGCCELYDHSMSQAPAPPREAAELVAAIERQELVLHYQPILSLAGAHPGIVACEALLRWRHPERGLLPPGEFILAAEESGLMPVIDQFVLRTACHQAALWRAHYGAQVPAISLNLSSKQLTQFDLAESVERVLAVEGLDPAALRLELTESGVLAGSEAARAALRHLKHLGVPLYLDDFGTGYSSLTVVLGAAVDGLKIDHTLVRLVDAEREGALVRGTLALARSLGLAVVAEGIETPAQLACLRELGCPEGQGFLFAPALEPDHLEALIAAGDFPLGRQAP
ncbi:MAG TPA: EAL domain-containing protein [Thermomicrobiaceae bacterium]|nr:EAL domain-containing protein [Thermomicrobiaceae bacterium]